MKRLRVVIADDSSLFRDVLRALIEADGDIEVIGEAANGDETIARVEALAPDLATVDVNMPGLDGLAAIERIMAHRPVPVLVVTGQPTDDGGALAFEAVRRGALDIVAKSTASDGVALRKLVRRLAAVPVVRHLAAPTRARLATPPPVPVSAPVARDLVAIASSSGGPSAVATLLGALPRTFGACIAVVQHLPIGFVGSFARFLRDHTALPVAIVDGRAAPTPGTVLLATDDRHLTFADDGFVAASTPPVGGHRPSATALFGSLARTQPARTVGVILSGMGNDGVAGLKALRQAGGLTIAQDHQAAVWGMPKAAIDDGAVDHVLPIEKMARFVETSCCKVTPWR
jgi:two-component system chemotaxis response regulator CheB